MNKSSYINSVISSAKSSDSNLISLNQFLKFTRMDLYKAKEVKTCQVIPKVN